MLIFKILINLLTNYYCKFKYAYFEKNSFKNVISIVSVPISIPSYSNLAISLKVCYLFSIAF